MPIEFYKKEGETPLEALGRLRAEKPELAGEKMTYAGRLDPLASGVLLVLAGEECKQREKYLGLDKEYEAEILCGIATDTSDVLGLVTNTRTPKTYSPEEIKKVLAECVGKQIQTYPAYSSKTVGGRALHEIARADELDSIEIPTKEIEIYSIDFLGTNEISAAELLSQIESRIQKVSGDFRQKETIELWQKTLDGKQTAFQIIKIRTMCSSGTYIRTLAEQIGKKLGIPALALKIVRTKILQKEKA